MIACLNKNSYVLFELRGLWIGRVYQIDMEKGLGGNLICLRIGILLAK